MKLNFRFGILFVAFLLLLVYIAAFLKTGFIRTHGGDVLVIVLMYCFCRIFLDGGFFLPFALFIFAVGVEVSQYFGLAEYLGLTGTVLGIVLGATFDWMDIASYFAGTLIVLFWRWREQAGTVSKKP